MSFEHVKSIAIEHNKVYITSASSNVSPFTYERWESPKHTKLFREGGYNRLIPALAVSVWSGDIRLKNGSKLTRLLREAYEQLDARTSLRYFLDSGHASEFMTDYVLNKMNPSHPAPDIAKLEALRHDPAAVLEICKMNHGAFVYAAKEITTNREVAKEYVETCAGGLGFNMPSAFVNDKELAMIALNNNGCIYRQLSNALQADKDIVRSAFDMNVPRQYFEHLPDLIPKELRKDIPFMQELVTLCPRMHITRAKDLLQNKDILNAWIGTGKWNVYDLRYIPKEFLMDKEIQSLMLHNCKSDRQIAEIQRQYWSLGLVPPKRSLDEIIQSSSAKEPSNPKKDTLETER